MKSDGGAKRRLTAVLRRIISGKPGEKISLRRFLAPMLTIAGGTAVAQLILLAATPVITRIFTPAEFGAFGIFLSVTMLLGAVGSLGYDRAVPLPETERDAVATLMVAFLCGALSGLLTLAVLLVLPRLLPAGSTAGWLGGDMLWLAPPAIVLQAWTLGLQYWFIRRKHYRALPTTRIATNVGVVIGQIGLGLINASRYSLALGQVLGTTLGAVMLGLMGRAALREVNLREAAVRIRAMTLRYVRFPAFVLPSLFLNRGAFYIPTILVGALYGVEAAGFFALSQRLVGAPVEWMKQGVSQVLYGESSERARNNPAELLVQFHAVTRILLIAGTAAAIGIAIAAEFLIAPVFGERWGAAARFLQAMAFLVPFRAAYASTSQFNAIERQDLYLYWTVMQFVVVAASLGLPHWLGGTAVHAVFWYAAGSAFNYFVMARLYVWAVHRFLASRPAPETDAASA